MNFDDLQAAAVAARRRQLFNRDDLDEAKKVGTALYVENMPFANL